MTSEVFQEDFPRKIPNSVSIWIENPHENQLWLMWLSILNSNLIYFIFCRGHIEDVYDLSWSPDGNSLISGSVDNSAIIWDVVKGAWMFPRDSPGKTL